METTTQKKIYNLIILDESGSMDTIKNETIFGFNELGFKIQGSQKMFPNQSHFITLVTFNDNGVKYRLINRPINEYKVINENLFNPQGKTPLYDAICRSVLKLKHDLYYEKDYNVLVTIITDGEENDSKEFGLTETRVMIEHLSENSNWAFGLIGANIDVDSVACSLSIPIKRTIKFDANDNSVKEMFDRYGKAQEKLALIIDDDGDCDDLPF